MKYLWDTDTCIYWFKGIEKIKEGIKRVGENNIAISIITLGELNYGVYFSEYIEQNLERLANFLTKVEITYLDEEIVEEYGKRKAKLRKEGRLIEDFDLLNASVALNKNWTLVTNNLAHYERIEGLKIENWLKERNL
ncbi:MAG: PIN domain-containing protein [bacterium]